MHFEMHFPTPRKNEFFSKSKMLQRYYLFLNITKKKRGNIYSPLFVYIFICIFRKFISPQHNHLFYPYLL